METADEGEADGDGGQEQEASGEEQLAGGQGELGFGVGDDGGLHGRVWMGGVAGSLVPGGNGEDSCGWRSGG